MKKQEKVLFVENLTEELKSSQSVVLVNYAGLSVKAQQELKRRLADVGAKLIVVKNTLLKRAGEAAKIDSQTLTDSVLTGQTALILSSQDAIATLSVLGKFSKEFEGESGNPIPSMKVGIIDGVFQNTEDLIKLSNLPGRDVLLGQLLAILTGPSSQLVTTLNANTQALVYVLRARVKE